MTTMTWVEAADSVAAAISDGESPEQRAAEVIPSIAVDEIDRVVIGVLVREARLRLRSRVVTEERAADSGNRAARKVSARQFWSKRGLPVSASARASDGVSSLDRLMADTLTAIDAYSTELRVEWTDRLLQASFAMKDGARVKWGEATLEQHRERAEMFGQHALNQLEGAARHRAAIRDITEFGATCLNEVVERLAA